MNSRTFYVFTGSTKGFKWMIRTRDRVLVEGFNVEAELLNEDMDVEIANLTVVREDLGIYHATINTAALALDPGTYVVRFHCNADGNDYVQVDYLKVEMKG